MRKPNALARLVLGSGATEQVENALMILRIDAPAIVGDLENGKAKLGASLDRDLAGNPRFQIFDRIVDQIGKNLLERKSIADEVGQVPDLDPGMRLGDLMGERGDDALDQLAHVDRRRLELAPSFAGEVEDGRNQAIPLA